MPATNAWDETKPAGSDLASTIDNQTRQLKLDIRERLAVQHYWNDSLSTDGIHKEISITPATTNTALLKTNSNQSLTGSNAVSIVDLGATWNTSGTPTAVKVNVTDTASNAASLLLDLQVGGVSQFKVSKGGNVTITGSLTGSGTGLTGVALLAAANTFSVSPQVLDISSNTMTYISSRNQDTGASAYAALIVNPNGNSWAFRSGSSAANSNALEFVLDALGTPTVRTSVTTTGRWSFTGTAAGKLLLTGATTGAEYLTMSNSATNAWFGIEDNSGSTFSVVSNAVTMYSDSSAGIAIKAAHASGQIKFYSGGAAIARFLSSGEFEVGKTGEISIVSVISFSLASSSGAQVTIGRNTNGSTAAGTLALMQKGGTFKYLWVDATGVLRIHTSPPDSAGSVSDTAGTVVGTQT